MPYQAWTRLDDCEQEVSGDSRSQIEDAPHLWVSPSLTATDTTAHRVWLSHPQRRTVVHMSEVGHLSWHRLASTPGQYGKVMAAWSGWIGVCHDFGKYTDFFQDYIRTTTPPSPSHLKNHAFLSAMAGAMYVHLTPESYWTQLCQQWPVLGEWMSRPALRELLTFYVILHHHGHQRLWIEDVFRYRNDATTFVATQQQLRQLASHRDALVDEWDAMLQVVQSWSAPTIAPWPHVEASHWMDSVLQLQHVEQWTALFASWEDAVRQWTTTVHLQWTGHDPNHPLSDTHPEHAVDVLNRISHPSEHHTWADESALGSWYATIQALYGTLVACDKFQASMSTQDAVTHSVFWVNRPYEHEWDQDRVWPVLADLEEAQAKEIPPENPRAVETHRVRSTLQHTIETAVQESAPEPGIYRLTAPTGSGKTHASIRWASAIRQHVAQQEGWTPRVFYALPYTNILDGTEADLATIWRRLHDTTGQPSSIVPSEALLAQHHAHQMGTWQPDDQELATSDSLYQRFLWESSWDSEWVLTTHVSFWHHFIATQQPQLMGIPSLIGSVLIFDEVQAFPREHWPTLYAWLRLMVDVWGCRILLMSATQPQLPEHSDGTWVPTSHEIPVEWGTSTPAIKIQGHIHTDTDSAGRRTAMSVDTWIEDLVAQAPLWRDQRVVIMVNQVALTRRIFAALTPVLSATHQLFRITREMPPVLRNPVIRSLQAIERHHSDDPRPYCVVATQTLEAGVDVDADILIRDFAPWDNLVQAMGRCNRHAYRDPVWTDPQGHTHPRVTIVWLKPETSSIPYATTIYEGTPLRETWRFLNSLPPIWTSADLERLTPDYFLALKMTPEELSHVQWRRSLSLGTMSASKYGIPRDILVEQWPELQWGSALQHKVFENLGTFSLIKSHPTRTVVLLTDPQATALIAQLRHLYHPVSSSSQSDPIKDRLAQTERRRTVWKALGLYTIRLSRTAYDALQRSLKGTGGVLEPLFSSASPEDPRAWTVLTAEEWASRPFWEANQGLAWPAEMVAVPFPDDVDLLGDA